MDSIQKEERTALLDNEQEDTRGKLIQAVWKSGSTGRSCSSGSTRNIIIAILNVVSNVMMNVSLPIFAGTMDEVGGDAFILLINTCFIILILFIITTKCAQYTIDSTITLKPTASYKILLFMGFLTALNGILVVFASPPDRTPGYLQGILSTTTIPFTVICRFLILRKGISPIRIICVCVVMSGLFITVEPQIWGIDTDDDSNSIHESTLSRILWPLCFAIGFLPIGIMNAICEKELQKKEGESFSFIMWSQFFQLGCMICLFWVDFIPGFGMAKSPSEFWTRMKKGISCCYSSDATCKGLTGKSWIFYIGYTFGNLFQYLLIQYAEGAVYAVIVQALIAPLATVFWTLFKFDISINLFHWDPVFNTATAFAIVGLCIMVPGVIAYNYFSNKEGKESRKNMDIYISDEIQ